MKLSHSIFNIQHSKLRFRGFILPFSLILSAIILLISMGISNTLVKEIYFSSVGRDSKIAYYIADSALECVLYIDDTYTNGETGQGIFPESNFIDMTLNYPENLDITNPTSWIYEVMSSVNNTRNINGLPYMFNGDIKCATSIIFGPDFKVSEYTDPIDGMKGVSSNFPMEMDAGDGTSMCAYITVNKTSNFRQIIARGYNTCSENSSKRIERAVISN